MDIILSHASDKPIYEQITSQVKRLIATGALAPGELLPSMRTLARDLRISVITTKRAYEELEREGFLITQTGRGSFVAPVGVELLREEQLRAVEEHLTNAVRAAHLGNLDETEFLDIAKTLFEEEI